MTYKPKPTPQSRVMRARKVANDAIAHAQVVAGNEALARSTRTRAIYKVKAVALDKVLGILNGQR
jgi:hypothetical protein